MSDPATLIDRVQRVLDAVGFDYRACWVKGGLSRNWKARVPAILLSLGRVRPTTFAGDLAGIRTSTAYNSSKDTINFFNEHWSDHVTITAGKKLVSLGNYDDFRDHGVMPLVENGLAVRNTSVFAKNLNGKDTAYRVTAEAVDLIEAIDTPEWDAALVAFETARADRGVGVGGARLTVSPANDAEFSLHQDKHNWLQQQIIERMLPHFAPSYKLVYAADTEERSTVYNDALIAELGLEALFSEKKPDIVAFDPARSWVFVVEAVTSTGHISESRKEFFLRMLGERRGSAVFVTAFPDRDTFRKFAADMAWETEVWLATEPEHMIHFNGERFLGPY
jgi:hypothetical protein